MIHRSWRAWCVAVFGVALVLMLYTVPAGTAEPPTPTHHPRRGGRVSAERAQDPRGEGRPQHHHRPRRDGGPALDPHEGRSGRSGGEPGRARGRVSPTSASATRCSSPTPKSLKEETGLSSYVVELKYADAIEVADGTQEAVRRHPGGSRRQSADRRHQPARHLSEIQTIVRSSTCRRSQVMLEARIIEVSTDDAKTLGIDWDLLNRQTFIIVEGTPVAVARRTGLRPLMPYGPNGSAAGVTASGQGDPGRDRSVAQRRQRARARQPEDRDAERQARPRC